MGSGSSKGDDKYKGALQSKYAEALCRILLIKQCFPNNLACKHFDMGYFNSLSDEDKPQLLKIVRSGIENPDSGMGCYAMNPSDYDKFKPFFSKVLAGYHKVPEDAKHVNDWNLEGIEGLPEDGKLDLTKLGLGELSMRVRVGRNLADFPLPGTDVKAKAICKPLVLSVRGLGGEHTAIGEGGVCDISPSARFCIKEAEIITALYNGIKQLKEKEDSA